MTNRTRQEEIRAIHKRRHKLFYKWLGILVIIPASIFLASAIFFNIGAMFFDDDDHDDYRLNFGTEMMGVAASIVITSFIIDRLQANRDKERQIQDLKDRLVREAGSRSNDIAIFAVEQLQDKGWLRGIGDNLLQGARLRSANLQGVDLRRANLQGVDLTGANLQEADLAGANLQEADLTRANLQRAYLFGALLPGAILTDAYLRGANLFAAYLPGADLTNANLHGVDLAMAKLQGANLTKANLQDAGSLHEVTLPDGNKYTDNIDIKKFTDPTHPEFAETLEKVNEIRRKIRQGLKL